MDANYNRHDVNEMIFLTKRKEALMSIQEHIVYEFLYHKRLLKLTPEERTKIIQLRESLTKLIMEWED